MYDKVKLVLHALPIGYNWQSVLSRIVAYSYRADGTGGLGWWHGRTIIATETCVSFEGSLPKSLWGHNTHTMSLNDVECCIMMLSEDLGVPMYDAEVEYVEFAHNFEMSQPPVFYLRKLSGIKGFTPNDWAEGKGGTVYFDKEGVRVKFYDKISEAKKKKELPKVGRSGLPEYLLRYEITLKKKELFKLFRREITAGELWDKRVFWTLVAEWFGYYEDMEKLPNDCLDVDFNIFESAKDFDKWCICIVSAGQNLGYYVKNVLFKLRKNPQPEDRVRHAQFQKRIQDASEWGKNHLVLPSLILELTDKIEHYLTWLLESSEDGMSIEEEQQLFYQVN